MSTTPQYVIVYRQEGEAPTKVVGPFDEISEAQRARIGDMSQALVFPITAPPPPAVALDTIKARTILRELVKGKEDFVYEPPGNDSTCVNWVRNPDGTHSPSCLIGQLWWKLGFDQTCMGATDNAHSALRRLTEDGLVKVPEGDPVGVYLRAVQASQDSRHPWGEAMKAGERELIRRLATIPAPGIDPKCVRDAALAAWE